MARAAQPRRPARSPRRAAAELRLRSWRRVQRILHEGGAPRPLRDPVITHQELWLPRLPLELEGVKIAHLSDIHFGLYLSRRSLLRVIELTAEQQPELIVLTGDFVTQSPVFIEPVSELLGRLQAPLGVWAVLGNHDFRAGADRLTRALTRQGIRVLRNQHREVRQGKLRFRIAGVDDSRQKPNVARAVGDARAQFTILLAHNPQELEIAARCGVDLVLSGHTHGGQIKFNFARPLYERFLPSGLLSHDETQMYVSRGLGKVIVPMRLGAPAELAFLRLRFAANGARD